jgi:tetratricopeptide (TPR) repeat protein
MAVIIFLAFHAVPVIAEDSVVEQARRHFDRGMAAVEMAKTPADYEKAIQEFEKAAQLAPQWPDVYYNLGLVQEQAERYGDAVTSLKQYLGLAPNASDAPEVKSVINKLEYRKEQLAEEAAILNSLVGTWFGGPGRTSGDMYIIIKEEGGKLYLTYETTHILGSASESFDWHTVPITRKGRNIRFSLQFRFYEPSTRRYGGETGGDYNLELIGSGLLKGSYSAGAEASFTKKR